MPVPQNILQATNDHQTFLAHAHLGPDPDSVGSILAFKLGLESIGKTVHLFAEDDLPTVVAFLPQAAEIKKATLSDMLSSVPFDAYVCLDTGKWPMVSHQQPLPEIKAPVINIDHHYDNQITTPLSWLEPAASSATELVYHLLTALEIKITPQIATIILLGLLSDTIGFHAFNTTPASLRLAADLKDLGGDYSKCVRELFHSHPLEKLQTWAIMLKNLQRSPDGAFVWTIINYESISQFKYPPSAGEFANFFIGSIAGIKFGAVLTEKTKGITKGALRSADPDFDTSIIAHHLGGGGHKQSSGFILEKPAKEAEAEFLNAIRYLQDQGKL